jgi:hypothetical protein
VTAVNDAAGDVVLHPADDPYLAEAADAWRMARTDQLARLQSGAEKWTAGIASLLGLLGVLGIGLPTRPASPWRTSPGWSRSSLPGRPRRWEPAVTTARLALGTYQCRAIPEAAARAAASGAQWIDTAPNYATG